MDDDMDDKDDTKRRSRNLSEKKRRDQFNMLINELSSMVATNNRKMDKSSVLKSTIAFLESHNELAVRSRAHEIQEDWKPSFLSNEEFTHLILEAVDGFIIAFSTAGQIIYVSGSITSLLGHLPNELMKQSVTIFDYIHEEDQATLYSILSNYQHNVSPTGSNIGKENQLEFSCHIRRGIIDYKDEPSYDLVHFVGYFRTEGSNLDINNVVSSTNRYGGDSDSLLVFVGTGKLDTPQLIREMTISDGSKSEFTSRHNLDWKFLALDSRATPIIGYVQLEVVGTSGYDYYHIDDLDKIVVCHEALVEKGECTSCYYRFLTKGQQWIWLQTRFYISYHQWNSKPEFIVCTHRVVSYVEVMHQFKKNPDGNLSELEPSDLDSKKKSNSNPNAEQIVSSPWSSKLSVGEASQLHHMDMASPLSVSKSRNRYQGPESDSASVSEGSPGSRHSQITHRVQTSSKARQSISLSNTSSLSLAQATTTFVEPQQQFAVTAIPLQPIIGFPGTTVVTSLPAQESQLSDDVKRKRHELNQLRQLMYKKEEELQQCLLAQGRCGVLPSLINVAVTRPATSISSSTQPNQATADLYVAPYSLMASPLTLTTMSSDIRLQPANSSTEYHTGRFQNDEHSHSDSELIPFQFSQQQAQLLFTNISSPDSH